MTTEKAEIGNIVIEDILRVFKGDNSAAQLGSKGGNYFCFSCPLNSFYSKSIFYTRNLPYLSLQDRFHKIRCSTSTVVQIKSHSTNYSNYFANMSKEDIISNLWEQISNSVVNSQSNI